MNEENKISGYSVTKSVFIAGLDKKTVIARLGKLWTANRSILKLDELNGIYRLSFTADGETREECEEKSRIAAENISHFLGGSVFSSKDGNLAETVVSKLRRSGLTVSTAESCTAGLVSAAITDVGGASEVFSEGITTYADEVKTEKLKVRKETIETYGAVSAETAAEMCLNIRRLTDSDIGLSVTGVAGPAPSEGKPVGLVFFGLCDGERVFVRKAVFDTAENHDTRKFVREHAVALILNMLNNYLDGKDEFLESGSRFSGFLSVKDELDGAVAETKFDLSQLNIDGEETDGEELSENADGKKNRKQKGKKKDKIKDGKPAPRKHKAANIILTAVGIIAAVCLVLSSAYIANYYIDSGKQQNIVKEAKTKIKTEETAADPETGVYNRFDTLLAENGDFVGWLKINGTKTDNPVYKTDNNKYYLNHNMYKKVNSHGALFVEAAAELTAEKRSQNLTIYGHSMNDGSMFGQLKYYRKLDFLKQNPTISFETLYSLDSTYKVFSVFVTNATADQNDGYVFDYTIANFANNSTFLAWADDVKKRSIFDTGVDIEASDELITLSTCAYDFSEARLVVVARKTREGEDPSVDTSKITKNKDALFPKGYYEKNK